MLSMTADAIAALARPLRSLPSGQVLVRAGARRWCAAPYEEELN
jgi:hypothetical protein